MLAVALAVIALATATPAVAQHPIAAPTWSPTGTKIAWAQKNGAAHDVWAANADGTSPRLLASRVDALFQLAWLPSGFLYDANYRLVRVGKNGRPVPIASGVTFSLDRKGDEVAYQTADSCPTCHGPVEVLHLAGGKVTKIAAAGQNLYPALSPDGGTVAFTRFLGSGGGRYEKAAGIWLAPATGGAAVQRTKTGLCPRWSPDGARLAYTDAGGLHVLPRAGGGASVVLRGAGMPACAYDWSPAGRAIAAVTARGRLTVIDTATKAAHAIGPAHTFDFAWSPDGSRLLVTGGVTAKACSSLWTVHADGSGLRRLRSC